MHSHFFTLGVVISG